MINIENKLLFCTVEGKNDRRKIYRLPVVTGGAEPQEGGGIARAGGIPRYTYAPMTVFVPERIMLSTGCRFVKFLFIF